MSVTESRPAPDPCSNAAGSVDEPNPTVGYASESGIANSSTDPERTAWLERRRQGIGASDVAGILGLSPWASPWSVWADKVGLTPLDDAPSESQEFGLMAETMLREYFHKRTGLQVIGVQAEMQDSFEPWMRCTVDGMIEGDGTEWYEAKTTSEPPSAWADGPPVHYQCQATWTMAITGGTQVWFGVLHLAFGRPQFRVYQFERDEDQVQFVVDAVTAFWTDHVLTGIAPPADGHPATTDALAGAWVADDGQTVEADGRLRRLADNIAAQKAALKHREEWLTLEENELKAALGEATALTCGVDAKGKPIVLATWRSQDRTTVDTKALKADLPDIAAQYSKTKSSRVLLIKPTKES